MICHMGGIPTIRHNEIRDMTANLLTEICHNVATEPLLQPLTNAHRTANTDANARLDIRVEHGVFTPLVLSATGGMAREATAFHKRLADELSRKQDKQYSIVMGWIRCRLSFAILRSAILCIRGSRSSRHHPVRELNAALPPLCNYNV